MKFLSPSAAAKRLGLTTSGVRTLDDQLKPIRIEGSTARVYLEAAVDRVAAKRDDKPRKKRGAR